jgi:hypothetical protein
MLWITAGGDDRGPYLVATYSCGQCQLRTGSAFGVGTYWRRENVTVYRELPNLRPDRLGAAGGAFFDPNFPAPTISTFEKSKHTWVSMPTSAHFDEMP